jgi:hypothetical protein
MILCTSPFPLFLLISFAAVAATACGSEPPAAPSKPDVDSTRIIQQTVKARPKKIEVSKAYPIATLEGRWRDVGPKKYLFTTPTVNSVHVQCGRAEMKCTETITYVFLTSLDGDRFGGFLEGELGSITNNYRITEWSADKIVAVKEMLVATLELRIFPPENTADRVYAERADPKVFSRYVLE